MGLKGQAGNSHYELPHWSAGLAAQPEEAASSAAWSLTEKKQLQGQRCFRTRPPDRSREQLTVTVMSTQVQGQWQQVE